MATVTSFPIDRVPDDELAVQLWELAMSGERDSDAFRRIETQIRHRNSLQCALIEREHKSPARFPGCVIAMAASRQPIARRATSRIIN